MSKAFYIACEIDCYMQKRMFEMWYFESNELYESPLTLVCSLVQVCPFTSSGWCSGQVTDMKVGIFFACTAFVSSLPQYLNYPLTNSPYRELSFTNQDDDGKMLEFKTSSASSEEKMSKVIALNIR